MWNFRYTCLLLVLLTTAATVTAPAVLPRAELSAMLSKSRLDDKENRKRWDALQAISDPIKEKDVYLSHFWEHYKNSSISKRPAIAKEILNAVTKSAYLDSRIDLIGLLLFGPRKGWSVLRAVNEKIPDDSPGLKFTVKLFEKHCGVLTEHGMKKSLANIYNYAVEKKAIQEAIILACGSHKAKISEIDVTNPKISITPAPVPGTFEYCSRISVDVPNHVKTYQIMVVPSKFIQKKWHSMIHICLHRNDSLGLCQCEKNAWRSIQNGSWSSVMPPYVQKFVDVKFVARIPGSVTVALDEVASARECRYASLGGEIVPLFMVVSKYIFVQFVKCAIAVMCILVVYIRTALPMAAVCLALYYLIVFIFPQILSKKKLWPHTLLGQGADNDLGDEGSTEIEEFSVEFVNSPEFDDWVIKNAERIHIRPAVD